MSFSALDYFIGDGNRSEQRRLLNQQATELVSAHRRKQAEKRKPIVPALPSLAQVTQLEHVACDTGPITPTPRIKSDRVFHTLNVSACNSVAVPVKVIDVNRIDDAIVQAIEGQRCSLPTPRELLRLRPRNPRPTLMSSPFPISAPGSAPVTSRDVPSATFLTELNSNDDDGAARPGPGMSPADIMTLLDHERMGDLSAQFALYPGSALNLVEFVRVVTRFLPGISKDDIGVVTGLCRLFEEVDINGDGTMEWGEFTNYVIDAGMKSNEIGISGRENQLDEYERVSATIRNGRRRYGVVDRMQYFAGLDQVGVWEAHRPGLRLFDAKVREEAATANSLGFLHH